MFECSAQVDGCAAHDAHCAACCATSNKEECVLLPRIFRRRLQLNDNSLTGKLPEEWHRMQGLNYL
jgi:hypothetical protein